MQRFKHAKHEHKPTRAMNARHLFSALLAIAGIGLGPTAWAQETKIVPKDAIPKADKDDVTGWNPSVGVSGTVNFVSNNSVVGQVEGLSMLFGLGLTIGSDYVQGRTVWRNKLSINESFAKTPVIDRFVKTNDVVNAESIYNYFWKPTLGGFARLNINTALFPANAFTADEVIYRITSGEPDVAPRDVITDELEVAGSLQPFTLSESVGGFAEPIKSKRLNMRIRAGLGGRHTFASGVLVNKDDSATEGIIEMQELADVHQAGAELFLGVDGKAKGGRLTYAAGASVLLPFINNDEFNRSALDLASLGLRAEAKFAVFDWMSVVYQASLLLDPQLFPEGEELTQFQNSLLLTFQYTLVERRKAPPKKSGINVSKEAQKAAEEAQKAAEEAAKAAEEAAKAAEERARALELELEEMRRNSPSGDPQPGDPQPGGPAPEDVPPATPQPGSP